MVDHAVDAGPTEAEDLEDLFEHAPCGYISATADGKMTKVNQTLVAWLGHDRDRLVGQRFQSLLSIAGKIFYETHFAPLLRLQGHFSEVALDILRADGTTLPVLVNAVERRDEDGRLQFIRMTIFNASDRRRYERELLAARKTSDKANAELRELALTLEERVASAVRENVKAEEQIRQMQKMEAVGQLTGGIAHDFNNMLAIVIGGLDLMQRRLDKGDTNIGRYVSAAMEGANRAATLTQRLLAFSRQQPLAPQPLDANRMVSSMSELLRGTLGEKILMETVLAGGLWQTNVDAGQLENAVVNLAVNARDAMPEGGRLTIETANSHLDEAYGSQQDVPAGQYVLVAVTDNGTGMPGEVIAKAFEPFFTTKEVGKGTGLGLSQVFGFVKQSGGHVKIYSEPNQGTTVKIYLPRHYGDATAGPLASPRGIPQGQPFEVIVVVEDDDRVRDVSVQMLRDLGYGVLEARDGASGLDLVQAHPEIRLLFTDVVMPGMSGRQLADAVRALRADIKVLFTTGYSRNAIVHNGVLDAGLHLLSKPATIEQLALKVRAVLDA